MSIEDAIAKNTAALERLTAALGSNIGKPGLQPGGSGGHAQQPAQKPAPQPEQAGKGAPVTYDQVKKAALQLLAKNKNDKGPLVAIWERFGVKAGPELKPEQHAAALAEIQKALA